MTKRIPLTEKIIDGIFNCILKSDWNSCGGTDEEYDLWNKLSYPEKESKILRDQIKQQILENEEIAKKLRDLANHDSFDYWKGDYLKVCIESILDTHKGKSPK